LWPDRPRASRCRDGLHQLGDGGEDLHLSQISRAEVGWVKEVVAKYMALFAAR